MRRLAIAPQVLAVGEGVLVLERMPGETVPPESLGTARAAIAGRGRAPRCTTRSSRPSGGWPDWPDGARELPEYHARVVDVVRELAPAAHRELTDRVLAALPALPPADEPGFRRLHGDLWSGNVVWDGDHPSLVDWEYARRGDPAEELAYLIEMDGMGPDVATAAAGRLRPLRHRGARRGVAAARGAQRGPLVRRSRASPSARRRCSRRPRG